MSDPTTATTAPDTTLAILRRIEPLLSRLTEDVTGIKVNIARLEARLDAILPTLTTKADLERGLGGKPSKGELWGAMASGVALFAVVLTALTFLLSYLPHHG
jgi:hypothetical protein